MLYMSLHANKINKSGSDWDALPPMISEEVKNGKTGEAIFQSFWRKSETNREDWMYNLSKTIIVITPPLKSQDFFCLSTDRIFDIVATSDCQYIPLYYFKNEETRQDNITDWTFQ